MTSPAHNVIRPGMALLLQGLRGDTHATAVGEREWLAAFALAEREHVLPYWLSRLAAAGVRLPAEVAARQQLAEREAVLSSFWWTAELKGLLAAFAAAGIAVIALKGPSLAERIYGGVRLRECRDLDLLVRRADRAAAEALLREQGFLGDSRADDYHRGWRRGTTLAELHTDVENPLAFRFDIAGAWKRAVPGSFAGQPVSLLAPDDELLFLCLHGTRHRFERLSHTLDITLALRHLEPSGADAAQSRPHRRLPDLRLLGEAMARHLDPGVAVMLPGTSRQARHMQRVADTLWAQRLRSPGEPLDWARQHRFYMELEASAVGRTGRRLRHALILATRLIEADFRFARRFGLHSVPLVWILRQLRLLARLSQGGAP